MLRDFQHSVKTHCSSNFRIQLNLTDTTAANNPTHSQSAQPEQGFAVDASSPGSDQSAAASYGMIYSYIIPAGGYALNGNIMAHSDSVMGDWAFMYDTLNRLTVGGAAMNAPSTYANSMACWAYDSFGNRTIAAFFSSSTGDCSQQTTATASYNAANQVTFVGQSAPISYSAPSGFQYDADGNVYQDGVNTYAYDSEGRICAVLQPSYMGGAQFRYIYDASGLRVAKGTFTGSFPAKNKVCPAPVPGTNVTLTAQYLLNLGGEQVTELNGTGGWVHSNVWAGSHLDATYDTKGLHFRKYDPSAGRWLSPDPSGWNAVNASNPQSLNRYAYVMNNPMSAVDLDGLSCYTNWQDGVSVEVDDGDGLGCAAAGVNPASTQDPTGTNDGAISEVVFGGPNAVNDELAFLLGGWELGGLPGTIVYQPNDPFTLSFQGSAGMDAINAKIATNCPAQSGTVAVGTGEAFENTVIDGTAGRAGFFTPEAQLGAFNASYVRDGGTVSITVTNPLSLNSLLFHVPALFGISNPKSGAFSTIHQILQIQEADPCY